MHNELEYGVLYMKREDMRRTRKLLYEPRIKPTQAHASHKEVSKVNDIGLAKLLLVLAPAPIQARFPIQCGERGRPLHVESAALCFLPSSFALWTSPAIDKRSQLMEHSSMATLDFSARTGGIAVQR